MTALTLLGNVGASELRFTASGRPVLNLRIAVNRRRFNRESQQWEDVATDWHRAALWGEKAEAAAEAIKVGDRVIVTGSLESREYDKDGEKRTAWEIRADEVGIVPRAQKLASGAAAPWAAGAVGDGGPGW